MKITTACANFGISSFIVGAIRACPSRSKTQYSRPSATAFISSPISSTDVRTSSLPPSLFLSSRPKVHQHHHPSINKDHDEAELTHNDISPQVTPQTAVHNKNRREWMQHTLTRWGAATAAASSLLRPTPAAAATTAAAPSKPSSALCDPSVSTLTRKNRVVHILGTAHISSESAQLAGRLVREIKPSAVFLELDRKRISRAAVGDGVEEGRMESSDPGPRAVGGTGGGGATDGVPPASDPPRRPNPFDLKEKVLRATSQLVGSSIKSLYAKLESDGFDAGEEFAIAAREGLALGSTVVLGDQDVEVTLRRLTEALGRTDVRRLLAADSELERSMQGLVPEGTAVASSPGVGGGEGREADSQMTKEQFATFIETMKTKENVKLLMGNLRAAAPEIYGAMIGERDAYMAAGLDNLKFDSTVAVMGIAHVDGVEKNLQANGWVVVPAACPVRG